MLTRKGNVRAGEALIKLQERYCKMLNLDIQPEQGTGSQLAIIPIAIAADVVEAL